MTKIPVYKKNNRKPMAIGIFLSGSGTNFEAIVDYIKNNNITDASIKFVFSNVPGCEGLIKAKNMGFNTFSLSSKDFFADLGKSPDDEISRIAYDSEILNLLSEYRETDLIVLAGYRRKFSSIFYRAFQNRIINMYPGDITKDYLVTGLPASLQALKNGDKEIKCTVYIDREGERFGKAILKSSPLSLEGYNEENINELNTLIREKAEWTALPYTLFEIIAKENLSKDEEGNLYINDDLIPENGIQL